MCVANQKRKVEWCCNPATFAEWEEYAAKWISDSFQVPFKKKAFLFSQIWNPAPLPVDICYATIKSAMRALDTILHTERPSARQLCSLARKLAELDIPLEPLDSVLPALKIALSRLDDSKHKQAFARWRKHVATWHPQSKSLFRYLKNLAPAKATCLDDGNHVTSSFSQVTSALQRNWSGLEKWPNSDSFLRASGGSLCDLHASESCNDLCLGQNNTQTREEGQNLFNRG